MRGTLLAISLVCGLCCCQFQTDRESSGIGMETRADSLDYQLDIPEKDILYDKILGSLVGSAIGDAMGAPTEMWGRRERQVSYGYVEQFDPSFIDPSPEGLWDFHLPTGATTDDTRWKSLVGNYLVQKAGSFYKAEGPDPYLFAVHIVAAYRQELNRLRSTSGDDPTELEYNIRRLTWLQEWAAVAEPFAKKDLEGYTTALHRFYGGDLLCAGMLYAPVIGLPYPGDPLTAYQAAHRLGIFDQGYARDITGLTAAMVAAAMSDEASPGSIMEVFQTVDPHHYFRSRLFGREAFKTFRAAQNISETSKTVQSCGTMPLDIGLIDDDSLLTCRLIKAFEQLDQRNQQVPAHAQEILLVALTAMLYSDFDFQETMEFITNYGRDNDTSGAVAGAVLGAYYGYIQLPENLTVQVIKTSKMNMGIDLEQLATELTDSMIRATSE